MNKKLLIICIFSFLTLLIKGQTVSIQDFSITGIEVPVTISGFPDSVKYYDLLISSGEKSEKFRFEVYKSKIDTSIIFSQSGHLKISSAASGKQLASIRILPGWLSIVPPLLAILLALLIRQVITSLAAGIFIGSLFIYDFNPMVALLRFADHFILNSAADKDHVTVIVFTLLIGGMVGIISANGGTAGLANQITRLAKTAKSGLLSSWLMGVIIFFDDYANSLIIGNMMRPITDKLRISREKLSYIVDSTAAPVASLVIMSTWIGYELGLIDAGLKQIGFRESAYDVFLKTIPFRFYPIAALFFVFITSLLGRDFGPMLKAERRARKTGQLGEHSISARTEDKDNPVFYKGDKSRWYNGAVPIIIILLGTVAGLIYTGISSLESSGIRNYGLQQIISSGDSYSSLLWASFLACLIAIIMTVGQRILTLEKSIEAWHKGVQSMMLACIILVFAWAISSVTTELYTADFIISRISDAIDPRLLPVLVFFICALTSFATGTSWGTMAIIMPIVIPLSWKLSMSSGLSHADANLMIYGVVSSVLAGSVFGDHCSPIADTTILSSLASGCNHMDHVKTQLVYSIVVGSICMVLGDVLTAYGLSPYIAIILIFGALVGILYLFGEKVEK